MLNLTTRVSKGSILTHQELDNNFIELNSGLSTKLNSDTFNLGLAKEVTDRTNAIANEVSARDNAIASAVSNETSDRINAIAAEVINRDRAVNTAITLLKDNVSPAGDTLNKLYLLIADIIAHTETAATLRAKLGITTLSGSNTGDQSLTSLGIPNVENKSSATIRGELTKLNVTTALGFTPVDTAANLVTNEVVAGVTDGVNTSFAIASLPVGSFQLFMNGLLLEPGPGNDYTLSGLSITITMLTPPLAGFKLRAYYVK